MTVQIFVSYARDDDLPPPGRDELNGFVTTSTSSCVLHYRSRPAATAPVARYAQC